MNLQEIIVKNDRAPESLHQSDDRQDEITLTQFKNKDDIDPRLRELCDQLVGLDNAVQVRMVLSLYLDDYDIDWGGTRV